jgi:uncharacterized lipoprotein YddW (UPF0748 family)
MSVLRRIATLALGVVLLSAGLATTAASSVAPATVPAATDVNPAQCDIDPATPKRQFRGMWIASVGNLDWPSRQGLSAAQQQAEFRAQLDLAEQHNMNAVVVQVRPMADAFWPSPHEPWSQYLTGTQGGNPGYDPLAFMVRETHARGLEFHAWFNPYRVATHTNVNNLHASHPARQNPSWVFAYDGGLVYNPGIPAVRQFIQTAMMHAVTNYDIDAVHWDDYFYPYPAGGEIPDQATYAQYGAGFSNIQDWRRNNVDLLVQEMGQAIKAAKPHVKFGISPFGIWRNQSSDPAGSATNGLQSYDAIFADTRKWVLEEWIDYITPQVYWEFGHSAADYGVLIPWWSDLVDGTNVQLTIGQAVYKVGTGGAWNNAAELTNHLTFNRDYPQVAGDIHFRSGSVRQNALGAFSRLSADHYARPALLPAMPHLSGSVPGAPTITDAVRTGSGVELTIQAGSGSPSTYAVYRIDGSGPADPCDFEDASNLLGVAPASGTFVDTSAGSGTYTYYVTALDRAHRESGRSAPATVEEGTGPWSVIVDNSDASRFTASANWGTSSWNPLAYGSDYRFASPQSVSDAAWWKINVPSNGNYRVDVWYPSDPGYNSAAPYIVATSSGNQTVQVDQRSNGGQWVSLGTFNLNAGDYNVVGLSRWTTGTGYVLADAVRLTRT